MADMIRVLPGAVNNNGGTYELDNKLFQQVFAGEVLTAFAEINVMQNLHLIRTIQNGKSASFPAVWKAHASYHTPGKPLLGENKFAHNERIIKIDDLLQANTFVYELDELKNYFDVRGIYSRELGAALAREFDKKCFRVAVKAARTAGDLIDATVGNAPGGSVLKHANAAADGEVLAGLIFNAAQVMDEKDVPENDRYVAISPAQYYLMAQTTKILNRDWGGSGVYADGTVLKVAGVSIVKSNHLPNSLISAGVAGENNDYTGDFTDTVGIVFQRQAIGTVKLMDLAMQMTGEEIKALYQGTLLVAKMAVGHGILRPECAIELSKAAA